MHKASIQNPVTVSWYPFMSAVFILFQISFIDKQIPKRSTFYNLLYSFLLLCTAIYSFLLFCTARIMISILVLNPFSVLHLSFPLFLTSFFLAPIVWLPVTLFDTQSLKKNVFEVTSDQIFLQIFHFFSLVIPIYQLHRQSFFLCNSSFPIFCYNSKACTFVFKQKFSITSFHFSPFH